MGRLPDSFAGRKITMRIPYVLAGELTLGSAVSGQQFPDATYNHNVDVPFECHRMIPRVTGVDNNGLVIATQPDQDLLLNLVRVRITDFSKNVNLMKSSTLLENLIKGSSERTWEWAEPYYLVRSEGWQVLCDTQTIPTFNPVVNQLRVQISFEGFLVVTAPASEMR